MQQPTKKTTCEHKGHSWQSTASPFFRKCGRTGCKAAEFYINRHWIEIQPDDDEPVQPAPPLATQADLWA